MGLNTNIPSLLNKLNKYNERRIKPSRLPNFLLAMKYQSKRLEATPNRMRSDKTTRLTLKGVNVKSRPKINVQFRKQLPIISPIEISR